VRLLDQIFGATHRHPDIRSGSSKTTLGRYHKTVAIGMERFLDKTFGNVRAIGIGGIDEIDAKFRKAPQRADGFVTVLWLTPYTGTGNAHGTETETMNGEITADLELAGLGCVEL
jgi:hypothetical protein